MTSGRTTGFVVLALAALALGLGVYFFASSGAPSPAEEPAPAVSDTNTPADEAAAPPRNLTAETPATVAPPPDFATLWARAGDAEAREALLARWAREHPEAMMRFIADLSDDERSRWGPRAMVAWTEVDPDAAWAWLSAEHLQGVDGAAWRAEMDASLRVIAAQYGYEHAIDLLLALPENLVLDSIVPLVTDWAEEDLQAVAAWVTTVRDPRQRLKAIEAFTRVWAQTDPASAGAWAVQLDGPEAAVTISLIANAWIASGNIDEVAQWLDTLPPSNARDSAIYTMLRHSVVEHPEVSREWAEAIANEDLRNRALLSGLRQLKQEDPRAAWRWAERAPDGQRQSILQGLAVIIARSDADEALNLVDASPHLTPAEKEETVLRIAEALGW